MTPENLIMQVLAGGLLGMLGQGVRAVAGMKKIHDSASASGQSFGQVFQFGTLFISLLIGFTAGALALLGAGLSTPIVKLDSSTIVATLAAGYAGTDFIEAFMSKALPGAGAASDNPPAPAAAPAKPPAMG